MKRFEYLKRSLPDWWDTKGKLDELGREGWELVSIVRDSPHWYTAFLKRELEARE